MSSGSSIGSRWLWPLFIAMLCARIVIAWHLPMLGDEAFYWQESREPAWAYSDLPPMTAWLILIGTAIAGDTEIGVRWPFLLLAAAMPWLLRQWALRRFEDPAQADHVALLALVMPLLGIAGVVAVPDVPLTFFMLLAFITLDRAADDNRGGQWLLLGLCVAGALLSHWRAALLIGAGMVWMLFTPRGRMTARRPGLWGALAIALCALLPILWSDIAQNGAALRFQLVDRNPWQFQWSGLWIVPEQMLMLTPLLAIVLAVTAWHGWRERARAPFDLISAAALGIVAVYVVVGVFADNTRTRVHWPLPGYLPLLLGVPALVGCWHLRGGWRRGVAAVSMPLALLGALALLAALAMAASPRPFDRIVATALFGHSLLGWDAVSVDTARLLARLPQDTVLVADNFLLGAELDFAFAGERTVYVLDHPRNVRHGRQAQLRLWRRDEAALADLHPEHALLVLEVDATAPAVRDRIGDGLCRRFGALRWIDETVVTDDVRFLFAQVSSPGVPMRAPCGSLVMGRIDWPADGAELRHGEEIEVNGWALADDIGVDHVRLLIDGKVLAARLQRLAAPHVAAVWKRSRDPNQPNVGFVLRAASGHLAPGRHQIEIEVSSRNPDDLRRRFGARTIVLR